MARSNNKVVPESKKALDILKYEIAAELGLPVGKQCRFMRTQSLRRNWVRFLPLL